MEMIKKILVPIDFSDFSKNALRYAIQFAENFQAKVYIVYVIEPMVYPSDFSLGQVAIPNVEYDMQDRAKSELDSLIKNEITTSLETEIIIRAGKPFVEIIDVAAEKDIDLIIIATHGLTGVEHLLFGSTAEKVVRKAPCPVLSIREPIKGFKFKGN